MTRWILSPIALATLGLGLGLRTLRLDLTGRVFDWNVLIPLTAIAAILAALVSIVLLRLERPTKISLSDHPRHMWLVYPFWLLGSVGLGGGHGAIFFIFPFAALSGVMLGNLLVIARSARAAA